MLNKFNVNGQEISFENSDISVIDSPLGDLQFSDEQENILASFKNGHIQTKNFNSSSIEEDNLSETLLTKISQKEKTRKLRVLFIGNSLNQDNVTYLPWLFSNLFPEIDYEFGIVYCGGKTIQWYLENIATKTSTIGIYSYSKNSPRWTNYNNEKYLEDVLKQTEWDIISIQEYFYSAGYTQAIPDFYNYIQSVIDYPCEFGFLMHHVNPTSTNGNKNAIDCAASVLQNCPVSIFFSPYFANKVAMNYFESSDLLADSMHNREGLPCVLGAYSVMGVLLKTIGYPMKFIGSKLKLTSEIQSTLNIPGPNGTVDDSLNTDDNYYKIQMSAVQGTKISDGLFNQIKEQLYQTYQN